MVRPIIMRPAAAPDVVDPEGAGSAWHYLTPGGAKLDPPAYMYQHPGNPELPGWFGEVYHWILPDGYSPAGAATREDIARRIEDRLNEEGWAVFDRPEDWVAPVTEPPRVPFSLRQKGANPSLAIGVQARLLDLFWATDEWWRAKDAIDGAAYHDNYTDAARARVRIQEAEDRIWSAVEDLRKKILAREVVGDGKITE